MTAKDNTGDKLVASIRRTKTGATRQSGEGTAAKTTARRQPAAKSSPPVKPDAASQATDPRDPYQAARRVWPD